VKKAKYSFNDRRGKLFVDCAECKKGGNAAPGGDKCACGWNVKQGRMGGCFMGHLLDGLQVLA